MIDFDVWEWPQYLVSVFFVWKFTGGLAITSVIEFKRNEFGVAMGTILGKMIALAIFLFVIAYGGFFK